MASLPELKYTPQHDIPGIVESARSAFNSQKTKPVEFRLRQLRKLYWGMRDNADAIASACKKDLGKGQFETNLTDIDMVLNDIIYTCNSLEKWMKDETAPDIPLFNKILRPKIRKDPLGCVLIIGTYNFPVNLMMCPLVGAIAAGNTAVAKPSENAPNVALVVQRIITDYLDPSCYKVVQGAVPETTALLDIKWDKIFYTGGANVATIIAKKAAETLTPYTLELGGRNPAIVTKNADVRLAARRLLWGKIVNAGQVCLSQNYTLVDEDVLDAFVLEMKAAMKDFYPQGTRTTEDFGRIVNLRSFQRVKKMLDESKGKILMGGETDESDLYIEPTLIQVVSPSDSLIAEESFAPLLPILAVDNLDTAIRIANEVQATPLTLYPFGNNYENERMLREIRSGGASINDSLIHGTMYSLAFGGVGDSGQGAYRGKASFDTFTHRRSVTSTPKWAEGMLGMRYPPYAGKIEKLRSTGLLKPNFDRDGKVTFSLVNYILTLGAKSKTGGLMRALATLLIAMGLRQYLK